MDVRGKIRQKLRVMNADCNIVQLTDYSLCHYFSAAAVANLHKMCIPATAAILKSFTKVFLNIMDFIVKIYVCFQAYWTYLEKNKVT